MKKYLLIPLLIPLFGCVTVSAGAVDYGKPVMLGPSKGGEAFKVGIAQERVFVAYSGSSQSTTGNVSTSSTTNVRMLYNTKEGEPEFTERLQKEGGGRAVRINGFRIESITMFTAGWFFTYKIQAEGEKK